MIIGCRLYTTLFYDMNVTTSSDNAAQTLNPNRNYDSLQAAFVIIYCLLQSVQLINKKLSYCC